MEIAFSPSSRSSDAQIANDVQRISRNPIVNSLLQLAGGIIAVLNENRQIVALNDDFLRLRHSEDLSNALGLRFGEFIGCVNACDTKDGCNTSQFCNECGAAIAIVTSLRENRPAQEKCAINLNGTGIQRDLFLQVQSSPIEIDGQRYILLYLHDITRQQKWAALERVFFHDVNNVLANLLGATEMLEEEDDEQTARDLIRKVRQMSRRLANEVSMHRQIFQAGSHVYTPSLKNISLSEVHAEIDSVFSTRARQSEVHLQIEPLANDKVIKMDFALLLRVLGNMVTNAIEATPPAGTVIVSSSLTPGQVVFKVWNQGSIPLAIARRIFRRSVSTKKGIGRGVGTYSMKLFGEEILGGTVSFTSTEQEGTTFSFALTI